MAELLRAALQAGAIGLSTGRSDVHRSTKGEWTPSSEATEKELVALAEVLASMDQGVLQAVIDFNLERGAQDFDGEFQIIEQFARAAKRPISISLMQRDMAPINGAILFSEHESTSIFFQVAPRGIGTMLGLAGTFHPLMAFPSYVKVLIPLAERVAA